MSRRKRTSKPPIEFRISAAEFCFQAKVLVFATKTDFVAAVKKAGLTHENAAAVTDSYEVVNGDHSKSPEIGTIYLCREKINAEILVHEATHLALHAVKMHGLFPLDDGSANEPICYAVGLIHDSLLAELRARKVIS